MQFSVAELPLALFTTLAPLGAGAFIALACAFFATSFSDEQLKKIDRGTIIPLAIVIVGFICAFFHLASPMNAPSVFLGAGSPMSNEIIAGCVFAIVAIVYVIVTNAGKLCGSARKGFAAVVAVLAVVFAIFTGLAYVMSTIATWDTPLVPVQMLGFALVGGAATAALVLAGAGAWADACKGSFKSAVIGLAVAGAVLAIVGLAGQLAVASGMQNALVSGSELVSDALLPAIIGLALIVVAAALVFVAVKKEAATGLAAAAVIVALVGIFFARVAFYAIQMSVGIYFG